MLNKLQALLILTMLIALSTTAKANDDSLCRTKRFRCESSCSAGNKVGSAEHLKCNEQCRDDENFCRKIGFTPDRKFY